MAPDIPLDPLVAEKALEELAYEMSRTNDRRFLFEKGRVKTQLVDALKRAAAFSGVELEAYVAMDNHFHIVCKVVRGEGELPEGELLRRVAALKGERAASFRPIWNPPRHWDLTHSPNGGRIGPS